jgi:hypothetical protein
VSAFAAGADEEEPADAEAEVLESAESFDPSSEHAVRRESDSAPIAAVAHSRAPGDLFMSEL